MRGNCVSLDTIIESMAKGPHSRIVPAGPGFRAQGGQPGIGGAGVLHLSIGLVLAIFWLVLSGHYNAITLIAGLLSVVGTILVAERMKILDREAHPIGLLPRALAFYWPWLAWEILKSGWDVTKLILNPKLPISPTLVRVKASQRTSSGIATYANSITLTPGTITCRISGNDFLVHAITREGAESLAAGDMDRKVTRFEGAA